MLSRPRKGSWSKYKIKLNAFLLVFTILMDLKYRLKQFRNFYNQRRVFTLLVFNQDSLRGIPLNVFDRNSYNKCRALTFFRIQY